MFNTLLIAEHEEFESPIGENKISRRVSCTVETDSYKSASRKGISWMLHQIMLLVSSWICLG
jgi:hypothetical protein